MDGMKKFFSKGAAKRERLVVFAIIVLAIIVLAMGIIGQAVAQDDYEGPMSDMRFVVVKDDNGKPVRNAAVVLHPVKKNGKQELGGLELKTDNDGKANIDGIPYGVLRVQVLAPGFQTYGEDYEISKPATEITVKLKRPRGQFTTGNGETKKDDTKAPAQKPQ